MYCKSKPIWNNESESHQSTNPSVKISGTEIKCVYDRSRNDTIEVYIICEILQILFHLGVQLTDTVYDVKKRMKHLKKIPIALQHLFFKNTIVTNSRTLQDCGIKHKSRLELGVKLHSAYCFKCTPKHIESNNKPTLIIVNTISGDSYRVLLPLSSPIESLKQLIQEEFQVYPDNQLLLHQGQRVEDDVTFEEYGITSNSSLILMLFQYNHCKYCGGCAEEDKRSKITLTFFEKVSVAWALYPDQTIRSLKETTYLYLHHIHPDLQSIIYNDEELADNLRLGDCGMTDGSHVFVRIVFDSRRCDKCGNNLT